MRKIFVLKDKDGKLVGYYNANEKELAEMYAANNNCTIEVKRV